MAAEPHRSNQPLVNGQNETGSSKGNSDRETVDGEKAQLQESQPAYTPPVAPAPHLNWPRQQRPPDPRGLNLQTGARPPPHQGARRVSPWAVLRTKLPDQQGVRPPGLEHNIYRMQNPEDMMRPRASPDLNGYSRPPLSRPPSGQLSKPPSLEGPTPPGQTPPRSPFLQRTDSRAGSPMFSPPMGPGMMGSVPPGGMASPRPPSLSPRPPSVSRLSRDDDDEDLPSSPGPMGSRPSSAARFPNPALVRSPSGGLGTMPARPPSRTPPPPSAQSPIPGMPGTPNPPRTTPLPGRQSSVSSLSGQSDNTLNKPDSTADTDSLKSSTPSPRPLSAATSQESDNPPASTEIKPSIKVETKSDPIPSEVPDAQTKSEKQPMPSTEESVSREPLPNDTTSKGEDGLKRPNSLETKGREGSEVVRETLNDSKSAPTPTEKLKETVVNGNHDSPKKLPPKGATPKVLGTVPSTAKSPSKSLPKTPDTPGTSEKKKVPMNKIQVGAAPSPNLKVVRSKIGSLDNAKHKPGGGHIKIESRKLEFRAGPRIEAKNDTYTPGGGEKKIQQVKLQWNAKSKIGSLENATHKPGGGDKKIESLKLDFKDKAKPKVGSKDNIKYVPGGGQVKIEDQKLDIKAQSRVGSMDNVKHKPGGGEVKIFDDKDYMKQMMGSTSDVHSASNQVRRTSRSSSSSRTRLSGSKSGTRENLTDDLYSPEKPTPKPLTKPTDQNSNQLNRGNNETADKSDQAHNEIKKHASENDKKKPNEPTSTSTIDDKKPPQPADGTGSTKTLPSNPIGEPLPKVSTQPKQDFQAAVIEKSQTEMPEKELTKP